MQLKLELLAPAKNKDIGIAAINCGADAVYIAGPYFGAREAAGNTVADIKDLARYAHAFSAKVYVTINTILYDSEIEQAQQLIWQVYEAGADAIIVQDFSILKMNLPPIEFHASTQTVIRTPEQAVMLEKLGFTRLILERELSLEQIREIRKSVECDLEFFVHGALCVCYSGQCYLSQCIAGRSANRGECIQACRSKYDLKDASGKTILKNKTILSLKDYRLDRYIGQLAEAGIASFKIEGRLKNASYVKNTVRHYRKIIDDFISVNPSYCKSSVGIIIGGFEPNPDITFNRGYTSLFINGLREKWNSGDVSKSMGEYIGKISSVYGNKITIDTANVISNGDGFAIISSEGIITGMRVEICENNTVFVKDASVLKKGDDVYRNFNIKFEKEVEKNMPERLIPSVISYFTERGITTLKAETEDGIRVQFSFKEDAAEADKKEAAIINIKKQLGKKSGYYLFEVKEVSLDKTYFYTVSALNGMRRRLAELLDKERKMKEEGARTGDKKRRIPVVLGSGSVSYLANCSNKLAESVYLESGYSEVACAYELRPVKEAELMRTKYCIKYELGLCHKQNNKTALKEPLYLINNGYSLKLSFDCKKCEMIVIL